MTLKASDYSEKNIPLTDKHHLHRKHHYSLESHLKWTALLFMTAFFGLVMWIMQLLSLSPLVRITAITLIFIPMSIFLWRFYHKIITPFYSLTNLVEAIRLEDYSLRIKEQFNGGILSNLSQEIAALANVLQQRKQVYDQHTLLIYHLIEQLDAPIAIFNSKLQLSHANLAFSHYIGQPWQTKRLSSSQNLGLILQEKWTFTQSNKSEQWQIKQSQFTQNEQTFHLVVLTNIEKLLRINQQKSWQQIIRVLSHEIRNSLTPIKSLAQTLVSLPSQDPQSSKALQVIVDRSIALEDFVNRYGNISKNLTLNKTPINTHHLMTSITTLFPTTHIVINNRVEHLEADQVLLKQVLINLIKNAIEATESANDAPQTEIIINLFSKAKEHKNVTVIEIIDNGQGIANMDNLFVPFYTTKKQGQGIGLGLCQNIIEQHGGSLSLTNNASGQGATATIFI